MSRFPIVVFLLLGVSSFCWCQSQSQQDELRWRVSPTNINLQAGEDRVLQVIDDSAQELPVSWSVNDPARAEMREEDGHSVLHSIAAGTVRVMATYDGETRFRDITIWSADAPLPIGTVRWSMPKIGRSVGDIAAVPTPDGPNMFSVEQTPGGETYVRAVTDGVQLWSWRLPESTRELDLVCGDWLGGVLISANHMNNYTLYTVGKDGALRWQHTLDGVRKARIHSRARSSLWRLARRCSRQLHSWTPSVTART
jgi:hypothetical protein